MSENLGGGGFFLTCTTVDAYAAGMLLNTDQCCPQTVQTLS